MGWEKKIKQFIKGDDKKVIFLINLKNNLSEIVSFLKAFAQDNSLRCIVILFNFEIPKQFGQIKLRVNTSENYISKADCEEIDKYVFEGISKSWYLYKEIASYRGIQLGKIYEYDFQRYLISRIRNLEIVKKVIEKEDVQKIIVIEDTGELIDAAKICGKAFDIAVLAISFSHKKRLFLKLRLQIELRISYFLNDFLDRVALRRIRRIDDQKDLILIDAKLPKSLGAEKSEISFMPCPLDRGLKSRLSSIRQNSTYVPLCFMEKRRYSKDWITYEKKWQDLLLDAEFKDIFKYKGLSIWEIVCDSLSDFFLKGIPRIISNINLLYEIFKEKNIKIIVLRNDVKELEKTLIFCGRLLKVSSLVIQHGILAEPNGHNILFADRFAAWGEAAVAWYEKGGNTLEKFEITGNPTFDMFRDWRPEFTKQALCKRLNLDENKGVILLATQPINKFSSFGTDDLFWVLTDKLLVVMEQFPDKQLIIKVDPYEELRPYRERIKASSHNNAVAVKDIDIYTLISLSELIITQDSTVGLEAMIFNKPLITINLTKRQDRIPYAERGAALGVYNATDLAAAIKKILSDEKTIKRLSAGREVFKEEYAYKLDGKAGERMTGFLYKYLNDANQSKK